MKRGIKKTKATVPVPYETYMRLSAQARIQGKTVAELAAEIFREALRKEPEKSQEKQS